MEDSRKIVLTFPLIALGTHAGQGSMLDGSAGLLGDPEKRYKDSKLPKLTAHAQAQEQQHVVRAGKEEDIDQAVTEGQEHHGQAGHETVKEHEGPDNLVVIMNSAHNEDDKITKEQPTLFIPIICKSCPKRMSSV